MTEVEEGSHLSYPRHSNSSAQNKSQMRENYPMADLEAFQQQDRVPPTLTGHNRISIAVDPVALVITECIAVTSAMRKHARWAHSSVTAILGGSSTKVPPYVEGRRGPGAGITTSQEDDSLGGRWGLRGKKGKSMQDNPLISAFTRLRSDLKQCKGLSSSTQLP